MAKTQAHQFGLALGGTFGAVHLAWSVLVALGVAQSFMDFMFEMHMITPVYTSMPFSVSTAAGLVLVTTLLGYLMGFVLGIIWKEVQKKS